MGLRLELTLLGHSECHLCHEAEHILRIIQEKYPLHVIKKDIRKEPRLFKRFRDDIPVVMHGNTVVCAHRVDVDKIIHLIRSELKANKVDKK